MKRVLALLTVILASTGCSAVRGEESETSFGSNEPAAVSLDVESDIVVTFEPAPAPAVEVGSASIAEPGSASDAIDFVATELYSGSDIDGRSLFGNGSAIVTFVQPGCEFSSGHADLLATAASNPDSAVTYVFVHSGSTSDVFTQFVVDAGLEGENIIHLDDANGELSYRFGVESFPSTLLVSGEGQLSSTQGALDEDRLDRALAIITTDSPE